MKATKSTHTDTDSQSVMSNTDPKLENVEKHCIPDGVTDREKQIRMAGNLSEAGERTLGRTGNENRAPENEAPRISKSQICVKAKFGNAFSKVLSRQERSSMMVRPQS